MKIAIAGYGIEGAANYEYFRKFPDVTEIVIFDERESIDAPTGVEMVLGDDAFSQIPHDFMVVRTAGLSPRKLPEYFRDHDQITSSTIEFFAKCPAPIVGVTGSKGKGTVVSFVAAILRAKFGARYFGISAESIQTESASSQTVLSQKQVTPKTASETAFAKEGLRAAAGHASRQIHVVGNIGVPALAQLAKISADDIVVFELSSFQLWDLQRSPHIAVITNIEPDHLDVHENFADYVVAKSHISQFQTANDAIIFNADDALVREISAKSLARKIDFPNKKFAHVENDFFKYNDTKICEVSVVKLPGAHNVRNALAAIDATWDLVGGDVAATARGLANFAGLPHRLQFVREIGDVKFYDDSIATTPGSVVAALRAFDEPKILIVGGHDKGADYTEMAHEIAAQNVRNVFAIGQNRAKIAAVIRENSDVVVHEIDQKNMDEIVGQAFRAAIPGDVVILSPAAASFGMFENYADRGEKFVAAAMKLRKA